MNKVLRGRYNSSITRVRPVFQQLIRKRPTGEPWIRQILDLTGTYRIDDIGQLLPELTTTRPYPDRILKHYGITSVDLEHCFEVGLPPPTRFLEWLIRNPDKMAYQDNTSSSAETCKIRANLFGKNGTEAQRKATEIALAELSKLGSGNSERRWWAFEGFTEVDCYLETDRFILLVEGKRTETVSKATMWYPERNQIIRNLEVGQEVAAAKDKDYGVVLVAEEPMAVDIEKAAETGLPHMDNNERDQILKHYLGCLTWKSVCESTGTDLAILPDETAEVAEKLLELG